MAILKLSECHENTCRTDILRFVKKRLPIEDRKLGNFDVVEIREVEDKLFLSTTNVSLDDYTEEDIQQGLGVFGWTYDKEKDTFMDSETGEQTDFTKTPSSFVMAEAMAIYGSGDNKLSEYESIDAINNKLRQYGIENEFIFNEGELLDKP